jgi:hypothetical protein
LNGALRRGAAAVIEVRQQLYMTATAVFLCLGAASPALAGPDFDAIAHARKLRDADALASPAGQTSRASQAVQAHGAAQTSSAPCQADDLLPQLDHGPQAQTTPYLNRQRAERREAVLRECKERMPVRPAE